MIQEGGAATIVTPTPSPTPIPTPTSTPRPTPTSTSEPIASPAPQATNQPGVGGSGTLSGQKMQMWDLIVALVSVVVVSVSGYYTMRLWDRTVEKAFRVALWCTIGGLGLYVIYAFGLSYLGLFNGRGEPWTAGGAALIGSAVSLFSAWLIDQRRWSRRARVSE
jgi:hypothetical protein